MAAPLKPAKIRVPATSANLGPGFDCLGMALHFFNHFEASASDTMSVSVAPATCVDVSGLSLDPADNLLAQAYQYYFEQRGEALRPASLSIEAHVPLSRGMGSSSSAIVGGLFLADSLHPEPLGKEALLPWAIELEGHPDNVVPALLGGVHCSLSNGKSIQVKWPQNWGVVVVIPDHKVNTHDARAIMPPHYSAGDVVETLQGMGAWMAGLLKGDADLVRYAFGADKIHQPYRSKLIPEFALLQTLLSNQHVMGPYISGSGSTLALWTPGETTPANIVDFLKQQPALGHCKIQALKVNEDGACLVNK